MTTVWDEFDSDQRYWDLANELIAEANERHHHYSDDNYRWDNAGELRMFTTSGDLYGADFSEAAIVYSNEEAIAEEYRSYGLPVPGAHVQVYNVHDDDTSGLTEEFALAVILRARLADYPLLDEEGYWERVDEAEREEFEYELSRLFGDCDNCHIDDGMTDALYRLYQESYGGHWEPGYVPTGAVAMTAEWAGYEPPHLISGYGDSRGCELCQVSVSDLEFQDEPCSLEHSRNEYTFQSYA